MIQDDSVGLRQTTCPPGATVYTVRPGDTLFLIAQRTGTTVSAILAINPGLNPNLIFVGQRICIPRQAPGFCPNGNPYVIQRGDTFYALSLRFGVSLQALIAANPGVDPARLVVGQIICIPGPILTPVITPCSILLQPVLATPAPGAAIPVGAFVIGRVGNAWSYTFVAYGLPAPATFGNFDSYVGVIIFYPQEMPTQGETVLVRLFPSGFVLQEPTWAGTSVIGAQPFTKNIAEVRPYNSTTGTAGNITVLRNTFAACRA